MTLIEKRRRPAQRPVLEYCPHGERGVIALGVDDVERAATFWCEALGYERRSDGFRGWALVLVPPSEGAGTKIALQRSETPAQDHPRLHLDLHVASTGERAAEVVRLVAIGAIR